MARRVARMTATALELRLRSLESLLFGTPLSVTASPVSPPSASSNGKSVTRRAGEIKGELDGLVGGKGNEVVARFVRDFDNYHPLLFPSHTTKAPPIPSALDDTSSGHPTNPSTLLSPLTKLAIILQASEDIRDLEKELREVEVLSSRGVAGSGDLENHEALKDRLAVLKVRHDLNVSSFLTTQKLANSLLSRYSEYVNTVSELFVRLDQQIGEIEEGVGRLEKRQRDEKAGTY